MTAAHYIYAGRTLYSAIALPSLPRDGSTTSQLSIQAPRIVSQLAPQTTWRQQWLDPRGNACLQLADSDRGLLRLRVPELADFILNSSAGSVEIECLSTTDEETLEHLLLDQILPRLIAGRREVVLHASCVRIGLNAVLFLGESGWGKSTLGSLLHTHGAQLMTDDCVVLRRRDNRVEAIPTYPSLRLLSDSIAQNFETPPAQTGVAAYSGKRRVWLEAVEQPTLVHVNGLYVLNDPKRNRDETTIRELPVATACMALIRHGFVLDGRAGSASTFQDAADLARDLPAFGLDYPRDYRHNTKTVDILMAHVSGLNASML